MDVQQATPISGSSNRLFSGGYFKRFRGGTLQPWVANPDYRDKLTLEERITLTFLQVSSLLQLSICSRQD